MARHPVALANNKKHLTREQKNRRANNEEAVRIKNSGAIICPDWLDDMARAEFDRLVHELKDLGILSSVDITALAVCCDAFSKWKLATELVNKLGLMSVRENRKGEKSVQPNPAVRDALRYGEMYRKMSVECGLTPNARMRLAVKDANVSDKPQDELFKFLTGGNG